VKNTTRRTSIKAASTTAGMLLGGLPSGWVGGLYAEDGPETPAMRFGIIALTDCAPIVMAHELG
jgi:nitrate/nitrite transport system substrate-binding protein